MAWLLLLLFQTLAGLVQVITELLELGQLCPNTLNAVHVRSGVMAECARARACKLAVVEKHALVQAWQLVKLDVLRRWLAA
jgi:hypothetical protein